MLKERAGNRRQGGVRVTVCKPTLIIDGVKYDVHDFSRTGFEASLPAKYGEIGSSGKGELHFQTTGLDNIQDVEFEVIRVAPSGRVGATYSASNSRSTYRKDFLDNEA